MTLREVIVDDKGQIVRPDPTVGVSPSPRPVGPADLKPGQQRKEMEGVFLVRDGRATFVPVKTGIAGEKYFEVLSGLKADEEVITGPFASVRNLREGEQVRVTAATPTPTAVAK
jgi:HlyD family secretion protein